MTDDNDPQERHPALPPGGEPLKRGPGDSPFIWGMSWDRAHTDEERQLVHDYIKKEFGL